MKCYSIKKEELTEGISLDGLPCDDSLAGTSVADSLKVNAGMPDREGVDPELAFQDNLENAMACSRIVFSKPSEETEGRFLLSYDPREWLPDREAGEGLVIVYRSRERFLAMALEAGTFRMKSVRGGSSIRTENGKPVVVENGEGPVKVPEPEEGWFLATME